MARYPKMKITVTLECGCERNYDTEYTAPRPEISKPELCSTHGKTEISRWVAVGR